MWSMREGDGLAVLLKLVLLQDPCGRSEVAGNRWCLWRKLWKSVVLGLALPVVLVLEVEEEGEVVVSWELFRDFASSSAPSFSEC
jgi:hypothetical protein